MYKRKFFFIVFEGIEGCGKSFQSKKLFRNLKKIGLPTVLTREPGGTITSEKIRDLILKDYFGKDTKEKFHKYTDTLLYLAARNEHIVNKIKPAAFKKKIVICDRFTDSTLAYQVHGKKVNKGLIDYVHKIILGNLKPDFTFVIKSQISKAMLRLNKRKNKNRYDKFSKNFYDNVQKRFIKIAKTNRNRYLVIDNTLDSSSAEKIIFNRFIKLLKK